VLDQGSVGLAKSYDRIADILLLDSHKAGDRQIGALGVTHDWELDRQIVEGVSVPVIIAGGLGPENVADAIKSVRPAGVDSKTRTDKTDGATARTSTRSGDSSSSQRRSRANVADGAPAAARQARSKYLFRPYTAKTLFVWNSYAAPFILKPNG
jgi:hypothetical protein